MQYKVPQNIDMEDKIVGPFTMKQFVYLLVCGVVIYAWWNFLQSNYVNFMLEFLVVAFPVGLLGFSLALVKINDRPFEYFLLNVLRYIFSPKSLKWKDGYKEETVIVIKRNEKKKEQPVRDTSDLDQLAKQLEDHAATLQEKQAATKPKKSAAQIEQQGAKVNISVKGEDLQNSSSPAQPANPQPQKTSPEAQPTAQQPAQNKKKLFGIFG